MKKSELRQLIREEIKKSYSVNEHDSPDDGDVSGWYWPIADQAMKILRRSNEKGISIGAVGDGDGETYISITVDFPSGYEQDYDVYFDEKEFVYNILPRDGDVPYHQASQEAHREKQKSKNVNEAEFKHINPSENKIKLAIKDVEKKFRLKANRDNPPQYAQLSLNKIMLSKVLGREELGKEHQGAWEKLKQEYNLRDAVNEGFTKDDWDVKWKLPKDNLFNASKSIDAVNNRSNAIQDLLKLNPKALQAFNNDDEHPAMKMSYNELMRWYYPIMKESVNESKMEKEFAMIAARSEKSDLLMKISNELFPKIAKGQKDGKLINFKPLSQKQRDQVYIEYTKRVGPGVGNEVNEGPGQKHYTKDGKEWTGPTHKMPNGPLMTGDPHNDDSEELFHKADLKEVADPITLEIIGALSIIIGGSFGIKFGMDLLTKIVDKALKAAKYNSTEMLKIVKDNTANLKAAAQEGKKSFAKKLMSLLGILQ